MFRLTCIRGLSKLAYNHHASNVQFVSNTIGKQLQIAVEKSPQKTAVIFAQQQLQFSYEQLHKVSQNVAANLLALGVKRGDRVGIWDVNSSEWLITQFAAAQIGAILVNINPLYRSAELHTSLAKVGVSVLIMRHQFKVLNFHETLMQAAPELRNVSPGKQLKVSSLPELRKVILIGDQKLPGTFGTFAELQSNASRKDIDAVGEIGCKLNCDDPIQIIYTSGTTGLPKGATLTHHAMLNVSKFTGKTLGFDKEGTRLCSPMPFYHMSGCQIGNLQLALHNITLIVPGMSFDAESVFRAVQDHQATDLAGAPTMYHDEIAHPNRSKYDLSKVQMAAVGGAPVPPQLVSAISQSLGIKDVRIIYGSTEDGVATIVRRDDVGDCRSFTVGKATEHFELKVVNSKGEVCQVDEVGEVCTRSYSTMLGYWNDPASTSQTIDAARWYLTGDLGSIDQSGYLKINGRKKDLVIRGGRNIYPAEIEMFLLQHDKLADASVVGVPDDRLGEELCACVRLKAGQSVSSDELRDYLKAKIAIYKVPKYYVFMEKEFPMTVSRKVKKYELRETVIKELKL